MNDFQKPFYMELACSQNKDAPLSGALRSCACHAFVTKKIFARFEARRHCAVL
jgi:hypothetical protein